MTDQEKDQKIPPAAAPAPTITLNADEFKKVLDDMKKIQDEVIVLRQAANQGRLTEAENKQKPKELPKAYLKLLDGRVVIGWKSSSKNKILHNPTTGMPVGEILSAVYYYLGGGDSGEVEQVEFTRALDRIWVRMLEEDKNDKNFVVVRFETLESPDANLRETFQMPTELLRIHKNFLNP